MNTNFYLRSPIIAGKETSIHVVLTYLKQRTTINTGIKVLPENWNNKKQIPKSSIGIKNRDLIVKTLNRYTAKIQEYVLECESDELPISVESVKNFLFAEKKQNHRFFVPYFEEFITIKEKTKQVEPSTIYKYRNVLKYVKEYEKEYKIKMCFTRLDRNILQDYISFLIELNFSNNTIGKHIAICRTILNEAERNEIKVNKAYRVGFFKAITEDTTKVYLTEKELEKIQKLPLLSYMDIVRDIFLIGCYTGLRYSDLVRIRPENIKETDNGFILSIKQEKTKNFVSIPLLNKDTIKLLKKYDYQIPKISNTKINTTIKSICKSAGINQIIRKEITKGGIKKITELPKYELVSIHSARRSFATNMYEKGMKTYDIMSITGHLTEKSFYSYIRISKQDKANSILKRYANM